MQVKPHYIKVKFDTGITEYWALTKEGMNKTRSFKLPLHEELFNDHKIPKFKQFETNEFLYPEEYSILKNHFIIKKKDLDLAGWCDVRFMAHDLAVELFEEGYIPIQYTEDILEEDLNALKNEDVSRYQQSLIRFTAFSYLPPSGKRLIMHFMPCYARERWDFYSLYTVINKLLYRDFTREDIVYYLSKDYQITRHPAFYRALFKQWFDVNNKTVYDLNPNWGFKALATLIDGGEYYCDSPYLNNLQKLGKYIGGIVEAPHLEKYDLVIISDVRPVSINSVDSLLTKYKEVGSYLMISVKVDTVDDWKMLINRYKPLRVLRVNTEMVNNANSDNMIMIVKS